MAEDKKLIQWSDTQFWQISAALLYFKIQSIPYHRMVALRVLRLHLGGLPARSLLGLRVEWSVYPCEDNLFGSVRLSLEVLTIDLLWRRFTIKE